MRFYAIDASGGYLQVDVDQRLTDGECDFRHAPEATPDDLGITELANALVSALFDDTSGVEQVRLSSFGLIAWHSRAVPAEELLQRLATAADSCGVSFEATRDSRQPAPQASLPEDIPLTDAYPAEDPSGEGD